MQVSPFCSWVPLCHTCWPMILPTHPFRSPSFCCFLPPIGFTVQYVSLTPNTRVVNEWSLSLLVRSQTAVDSVFSQTKNIESASKRECDLHNAWQSAFWTHPCGWKLDRLGRSVKHLVDFVGEHRKQGVQFRSLTDSIEAGTPSGRFFFHVMASLAEMERELIVGRTRAGLEVARQLGRTGDREQQMKETKVKAARKLLASGVPARDVASNLGVSVPTLYRWVPASSHS